MAAFVPGLSLGRTISRRSWPTLIRRTSLYPLLRAGTQNSIVRRLNSPLYQSPDRCFTSRSQDNADVGHHDSNNLDFRVDESCVWTSELVSRLEQHKFDKCGFVVYRRDYANDGIWEQYKDYIQRAMRNLPGVDCEVTFVEDRDALDGATNYKIRKRHQKWAERAIRKENPRWEPPEKRSWWYENPRYDYFITHDALPLRSDQLKDPLDGQRNFDIYATDWFRERILQMLNFSSWDWVDPRHRGWVKLCMKRFQLDLYEELWGREPGDALQRLKWKRDRDETTIEHFHGTRWKLVPIEDDTSTPESSDS